MQGCRVFCDSLYTGFCRRSFGWHCVKRSRQLANARWLHRKTCDRSMAAHHNYPKHPPKADDLTAIRNIGVMAHIDAGKTTTTERMLYYSGFSNHLGDVDDGDTVMDYMEQERSRGITITSAAITFPWKHHKINLIDTPGHVDFTFEVERSLRAIDGAVAILDASAGVEAQTLTVWRQADRYSVPRIIYLNKMDKRGANIELCLKSISEKLNVRPLMLHMPIGNEREFQGIVDLVTMETAIWSKGNTGDGREFKLASINQSKTSSVWAKALKARTSLIGQLADLDERIAELVLSDVAVEKIPVSDVISALKRVTINQTAVPVLIGSSLKNKGVQHLLDGVNHFLPSPLDCHHPFAEFYGEELCALAFKITHDKQRGALTFLRLYSGNLKMGAGIYNVTRQTTEKIGRLLHVYANTHKDINHVNAGNIVCVTGLNQTITGDILTSSHAAYKKATQQYGHQAGVDHNEGGSSEPFTPPLSIPSPVFFCSIEPQSATVQKQLDIALANLQREDNSLRVTVDKDTGQTVLSGMGELHMEIIKDRIQQEYGIEVDLGPLQVAYKETITDSAEVTEVLDRTLGDSRHFVTMTVSVCPDQGAMDFTTVDLVHSRENNLEVLKRHHLQAINNGVSLGLASGPVLNFPVSGVAVQLLHFETTSKTSLAMVSACASQAVHKALSNAAAILLEPMMHLEITTDEDHLHAVLTDLSQRRSHINAVHPRDTIRVVSAMTPLAEMMGYSTSLRTITSGTAVFSMELSRYEAMNIADQKRAIEKVTGFMPE